MNHFEEYAIIESKIKELTNQKDSIRTKILEDMVSKDEKKIETPFGSFSVSKLKKWEYTEKVTALEEKYKAEKAKEESTGEATFTETPSLRFTQVKL